MFLPLSYPFSPVSLVPLCYEMKSCYVAQANPEFIRWPSLTLNLRSSSTGLGLCPPLPHPASFTSFAGRTCYTTSVRHYVNCLANELELVHSFYVRA